MIVSCKIGLTYGYSFPVSAGGGDQTPVGCTPCSDLYREAPPDRSTFFRLQVYKRVCILLVEEYERVRKSVILVGKAQQG